MIGRVVEIAEDGRHLSLQRGFLVVEERGAELGRVAIDDLAAVVANAHGLTYSNNLLVRLAEHGVPTVLCGPHHRPVAVVWPVEGHHLQTQRMVAQAAASQPLRKRLWQTLVKAKIRQQGAVLAAVGSTSGGFLLLAQSVRSGDSGNVEAQAARRYWPLLFGGAFRRNPDGGGINTLLNYGYAILRAGTARAVMAAGLHPSLGLHHHNRSNPLCLVDDLMEPFRPLVDLRVARLCGAGETELTAAVKAALAEVLIMDLTTPAGTTPAVTCLERLAFSLAASYLSGRDELELPAPLKPLVG